MRRNIIDTTYTHITSKLYPACDRPQRQVSIWCKLHPVKRPGWNYPQADKVLPCPTLMEGWTVISLLQGNHIIDKDYKWSFLGKTIWWLSVIFLTEEKMYRKSSGYFTNWKRKQPKPEDTYRSCWNHEPMVPGHNDLRYTKEKYKILAEN